MDQFHSSELVAAFLFFLPLLCRLRCLQSTVNKHNKNKLMIAKSQMRCNEKKKGYVIKVTFIIDSLECQNSVHEINECSVKN